MTSAPQTPRRSSRLVCRPFALRARLELELLEDRIFPSVTVGTNFGGLTFATTLLATPPDTQAAVGPSYVVEAVNANLAIYNKATGTRVSSQALSSFFSGLGTRTLTD